MQGLTGESKERKRWTCKYYQEEFLEKSKLEHHETVHVGQKDFKCLLCGYLTAQQGNLTLHIRTHTKERPYKCQEVNCNYSAAQSGVLKKHQLVHNKDDERLLKFSCSECEYKTGIKGNLSQHLKTHGDVKEFGCSECPFRCKDPSTLKRHMKGVHSTERPFKCPTCPYAAKQKNNLNKHLKIHSEEKNQVCPHPNCSYKTRKAGHLKTHMKIHSLEKEVKCRFCEYSCHDKSNLVVHMRRHTGETPYFCNLCSYKTKHSSTLKRHKKTHLTKESSQTLLAGNGKSSQKKWEKPCKCKLIACQLSSNDLGKHATHLNQQHGLPRVLLKRI